MPERRYHAVGAQCCVRLAMTRSLVLCFLLTAIAAGPAAGSELRFLPRMAADLVKIRLVLDGSNTSVADATADASQPCAGVAFSRNLKYRDNDQNVLDVATGDSKAASSRPVLLFVAGENFAGENGIPDFANAFQDTAMCFAARNGMVGVRMAYALAPANPWPGGARDVAAAISWIRENIDLFGGNREEIVAIGYSVGASHVASYLAHPEFQVRGHGVAGVILVSGIYRAGADASAAEKAYFGENAGKYQERSAFPGIRHIETPILLAWSVLDSPRIVAQGERLREFLCGVPAHCPRTTLLSDRDSLSSVFGLDAVGGSLVEPTLELVRIIEARGLP
jgi:acetyl esterase/lipase